MAKPLQMSCEVKSYVGETDQLVETDMDRLVGKSARSKSQDAVDIQVEDEASVEKLAVVLKLQLGSSQYATMALRELMKSGGLKSYVAEFSKER